MKLYPISHYNLQWNVICKSTESLCYTCMWACCQFSHVWLFAIPWTEARLLCSWDSPGSNTGVGCHFLLQGIFPTQGWNPGLLHCRQILYQLSHKGSPRILGVGSLSLLQWIFPTQESNQGLLHCRQETNWAFYQMSYQGSLPFPINLYKTVKYILICST